MAMSFIKTTLFYLHLAIIVATFWVALVLPLPITLLLIVIHRLHLYFFKGCIFSHFQKKFGDLEHNNFLQDVAHRLFKVKISEQQAMGLNYAIYAAVLAFAIAKI